MIKQLIGVVLCAGVMVGGFGVESAKAEEYTDLEVYGVNQLSELEYEKTRQYLTLAEKKAIITLGRAYCVFRRNGYSLNRWISDTEVEARKVSQRMSVSKGYLLKLADYGVVLGHNYLCTEYKSTDW